MIAAFYERFGEAREVLRVEEVPAPLPGAGEVRVRVHVSGANPTDFKMRRGVARGGVFARTIPHSDGAGIIDRVGAGVPESRLGERVWLWNAQWRRPFGTAAQYVALPGAQAVPLPENAGFEVGACLGIPALTAWRAAFFDGAPRGETLLVHGGAGAVGHYAVQFAARSGARVIATAGSPEKAEAASAAGAEAVIDHRREDLAAAIAALTGGAGVDRILEVNLGANAASYAACLKPGGTAIVYGSDDWTAPLPMSAWLAHGIELKLFIIYNLSEPLRRRALAELDDLLRREALQHRIGARFPLAEIALAHEAMETRAVSGNVVVDIP